MLFDDPQVFVDIQLFDDPQPFDDQLEVWTLLIEKSTVIPPSLMVLFKSEQVAQIACTWEDPPVQIDFDTCPSGNA